MVFSEKPNMSTLKWEQDPKNADNWVSFLEDKTLFFCYRFRLISKHKKSKDLHSKDLHRPHNPEALESRYCKLIVKAESKCHLLQFCTPNKVVSGQRVFSLREVFIRKHHMAVIYQPPVGGFVPHTDRDSAGVFVTTSHYVDATPLQHDQQVGTNLYFLTSTLVYYKLGFGG